MRLNYCSVLQGMEATLHEAGHEVGGKSAFLGNNNFQENITKVSNYPDQLLVHSILGESEK